MAEPCWVFATTQKVLDTICLMVYRSVLLRETDKIFAPVKDFIDNHRVELLSATEYLDPTMMFGRGIWSFSLVHPKGTTPGYTEVHQELEVELKKMVKVWKQKV